MRLLCVLLFLSVGSVSAQDFEILSVEVREPNATQAELVVVVQNNRRTASHFSVRADLPNAGVLPAVRSRERLGSGAEKEVVLTFDTSGLTRPSSGSVVVMNHRRAEVDREPFVLPSRTRVVTQRPMQMATEVQMTIAAPVEASVSEVTVRLTTGNDDRARGTVVFFRLLDSSGETLTANANGSTGSAVLATRETPRWASGRTETFTVALVDPVAPSAIHRAVLSASPDPGRLGGRDQWEVKTIQVEAAGRVLRTHEGAPFHRFSVHNRDRLVQLATPTPNREVNLVRLVLHTGQDDKRARGRVRFQVLNREGQPLNESFENVSLSTAPLPDWTSQGVSMYISRVTADEIGSIVITYESVQNGPFDSADNWDLAGVDALFLRGDRQTEAYHYVDHTAMGAPLHRFTEAERRFVLRLP
ncbi:MAG: hypothetical protein AAF791_04895 [Bacteroidota bacterium]